MRDRDDMRDIRDVEWGRHGQNRGAMRGVPPAMSVTQDRGAACSIRNYMQHIILSTIKWPNRGKTGSR